MHEIRTSIPGTSEVSICRPYDSWRAFAGAIALWVSKVLDASPVTGILMCQRTQASRLILAAEALNATGGPDESILNEAMSAVRSRCIVRPKALTQTPARFAHTAVVPSPQP